MEHSKIYLESCMDTMKRIGDKEIDLIVTSPPYNLLGKLQKVKLLNGRRVQPLELPRNIQILKIL